MDARQIFLDRHAAVHARAMKADGWWKEEDTIWADLADSNAVVAQLLNTIR